MNQPSDTAAIPPPVRGLQVLILEPDEKIAVEILSALEEAAPGTGARVAQSLGEAQRLVIEQKPVLFVLDVDATYDLAQEFIYDLRTSHPDARAIILTAIHFSAHRDQVAGLGAIHFLEKPFPRADFIALAEALLAPIDESEGERFQGTLSDLHIADIIQLKCISGATSMLEFTGQRGEKARVYFQNGQVRHASAPGKEGLAAFNEIVDWKGGVISEVAVPPGIPHTIELDWQVLLMEAVRIADESRGAEAAAVNAEKPAPASGYKILVIDDSVMLLSFVEEILTEQGYRVSTAESGEEGLKVCRAEAPDLILLDFVLPDMKGDEVCRRLVADEVMGIIPVLYVSGFGSDLQPDRGKIPNVIGSLSKPFTSDSLIKSVRGHLPGGIVEAEKKAPAAPKKTVEPAPIKSFPATVAVAEKPQAAAVPVYEAPPVGKPSVPVEKPSVAVEKPSAPVDVPVVASSPAVPPPTAAREPAPNNAYFCGDSSFFSLHWALQTIAREKLTGILRSYWSQDSVELLARNGRVMLVTAHNPALYCEEAPVTLLSVPPEEVEAARARQSEDGCPLFITLAEKGLILREPGLQLVQHYGQKLFSQLWTDRVRFIFEQQEPPAYTGDLPITDESMDQWALSTLRFVQFQELSSKTVVESSSIPAYTRDGYERVQQLRLTVAEAQFASQFDGSRSIAQISKNLRLDIKFARLTLFRFLALEIVECWPAQLASKPEARGGLRGLFGR